MRLAQVSRTLVDRFLGRSLVDPFGHVLLTAGTQLTSRYVDRIIERGYDNVYVVDDLSEGIDPSGAVSVEAQAEAAGALQETLEQLTQGSYTAVGPMRTASLRRAVDSVLTDLRSSPALAVELTALRGAADYMFAHAVNVAAYAMVLGGCMALEGAQLATLGVGAMLQDVGAVAYADLINKPGPLTAEEFERLKAHTVEGYRIVRQDLHCDVLAAHMAFQHHERMDGSGYPRGLRGGQILPFARVGAIADTYDALCARRPHRPSMPPDQAMGVLQRQAGSQLDAHLVHQFAARVAVYPTGALVQLSTKELALIAEQSARGPGWPRVRVITDPELQLIDPFETDTEPKPGGRAVRTVLGDLPAAVQRQMARSA